MTSKLRKTQGNSKQSTRNDQLRTEITGRLETRMLVFRLVTDIYAPKYLPGDMLELDSDPEARPKHGQVVLYQKRGSDVWLLARLSIRNSLYALANPRLAAISEYVTEETAREFTWRKPSEFKCMHIVRGVIRHECI